MRARSSALVDASLMLMEAGTPEISPETEVMDTPGSALNTSLSLRLVRTGVKLKRKLLSATSETVTRDDEE